MDPRLALLLLESAATLLRAGDKGPALYGRPQFLRPLDAFPLGMLSPGATPGATSTAS